MKSWILAIVAALFFSAPALAVDPPEYNALDVTTVNTYHRMKILVEKDGNNDFFGVVEWFGGEIQHRPLFHVGSTKLAHIKNTLNANVGEIVEVDVIEMETARPLGQLSKYAMIVIDVHELD